MRKIVEWLKVILSFREGNYIRKVGPVALVCGVKERVGDIFMAKMLAA